MPSTVPGSSAGAGEEEGSSGGQRGGRRVSSVLPLICVLEALPVAIICVFDRIDVGVLRVLPDFILYLMTLSRLKSRIENMRVYWKMFS